jgi:hypothetical protein
VVGRVRTTARRGERNDDDAGRMRTERRLASPRSTHRSSVDRMSFVLAIVSVATLLTLLFAA